ncbi:MAG TPA: hypothetical protein VGG53_23240 [Mycobacterium sp.]|jgi:hypothetical protein|uniref:hypothetical protein n=1 Tax=Mycobacterium sp. TaxID=1785 RepID=UPI002F3FE149
MLWGIDERQSRERPPVISPEVRSAVIGADAATLSYLATPMSTDDAPDPEATNIMARATIHPTVNGVATAGCLAGSTAVN